MIFDVKRQNVRMLNWAWMYIGVFTCDNIKETSYAIENEEYRVVDEEEAPPSRVQTKSTKLRASTMGGNAWC